jgi:hypothetical protein
LKQHGRAPLLLTKPKLQAVHEVRLPLSQSLRPARPPEEGERGADGQTWTLKGREGGESKGKRDFPSRFLSAATIILPVIDGVAHVACT